MPSMPVLSDQQRKFYEGILQETKQEINDLKNQVEEELSKVKDRISELQNAIDASKQMYAAACARLGVPNDMEEEDGGEG
jgi:gas vesicle protein